MNSMNEYTLELINEIESLRPVYEEHIRDVDELLPHVFFIDLTEYVISIYKSISNNPNKDLRDELDNILKYIEKGVSEGNEDIQELIGVSFLENLGIVFCEGLEIEDEDIRNIENEFGPCLKSMLIEMRESI